MVVPRPTDGKNSIHWPLYLLITQGRKSTDIYQSTNLMCCDLFLFHNQKSQTADDGELVVDPIKLSIFGHRFMGIAEEMGRTLQKTSISLNIKERLDFSCAIFSPDGELVANAPHVPVHLGSTSYAVRYQNERHLGKLRP